MASTRPTEAHRRPQPHSAVPSQILVPNIIVRLPLSAPGHWLDTIEHTAVSVPSSEPTCHPDVDVVLVTARIHGDSIDQEILATRRLAPQQSRHRSGCLPNCAGRSTRARYRQQPAGRRPRRNRPFNSDCGAWRGSKSNLGQSHTCGLRSTWPPSPTARLPPACAPSASVWSRPVSPSSCTHLHAQAPRALQCPVQTAGNVRLDHGLNVDRQTPLLCCSTTANSPWP